MAEPPDGCNVTVEVAADATRRPSLASSGSRKLSQKELERVGWSELRLKVHSVISSHTFDLIMGGIIVFNLVLMLVEADKRAEKYPVEYQDPAIMTLNRVLLGIYFVEACARAYVDRWKYFHSRWNCLDFVIVTFGVIDEVVIVFFDGELLPVKILPMLRILRIARLMRAVRLLRFFPELYVMIRGFVGAMKAMFWGLALIISLLVVWSLVMVEIMNPINQSMIARMRENDPDSVNEYCARAFSSVWRSMIFFFQTLVAGDSWGQCTLNIIEYEPVVFILFALSLVSVSLGFMNLILAVIVDHATAAREGDKEEMMKEKKKEEEAALKKWKDVIKQIDADGNGTITIDELMDGYEVPEVRDTLELMGIEKDDLEQMFKLMDEDGSGDLAYDEFIDAFLKAQTQDSRVYLMMTKLQTDAVARTTKRLLNRDYSSASLGDGGSPKGSPLHGAMQKPSAWSKALGNQQAVLSPFFPPALETATLEADFQRMSAQIQAQFKALSWSVEQNTAAVSAAIQASGVVPGEETPATDGKSPKARALRSSVGGVAAPLRAAQPKGEPQAGCAAPGAYEMTGSDRELSNSNLSSEGAGDVTSTRV